MPEDYSLANKTRVILVPLANTNSVTTLVMYPVGSRYEPEKLSGVSHYVEHLMFKGTKKRRNTLTLTKEIDRLGAEYNAFTGKEYTGYYIKVDASYVETAVDILADMLHNSLFDKTEMEREKTVIVEEIKMYQDNPIMNIDNVFEDLLYKGCPLGRDIAGTAKHVLGYKRPEVLVYHDKYYDPSNATLVMAGAIDKKTKQLIKKHFGNHASQRQSPQTFRPYRFASSQKQARVAVQKKETDQAQMMLGFPGFAFKRKENAIVSVMNTILGGSMSSRLFIQVRERNGLAYHVRSGAENFRDTGYIYVRAGLDVKNLDKAIGIIKKEIKKLVSKGVSQQELKDAKTHLHGALTLSLEDSSVQANWYARQTLYTDKAITPEKRLQEIDKVTAAQIKALANKVFKFNQMRLAVIGNTTAEKVVNNL